MISETEAKHPMTRQHLGRALRRLRTGQCQKQSELARRLGVGQSQVSRDEWGESDLSLTRILHLGQIYGFEIHILGAGIDHRLVLDD